MDRKTIYFGQDPLETDLLNAEQFMMTGLAGLAQSVLGSVANVPTLVSGLAVTQTTPASLNVTLNPGFVYQMEDLEATTWSSLAANTSAQVLKQGISLLPSGGTSPLAVGAAATIGITPPGTTGFSQVFLVEVQYAEIDSANVVLPYYNPNDPGTPFNGPGNDGDQQATTRYGCVAYQVKAGAAAPTGTQVAPTPDAGWVGIYTITVANGAATITSANIAQYAGAPFLAPNGTLPQIPNGVLANSWTFAQDTGTASALQVQLTPPPAALTRGMGIIVQVKNNGSGVAGATIELINPPGGPGATLGPTTITHTDGGALVPTDLVANQMIGLVFDGTYWQLAWRGNSITIIDTPVTYTVANTSNDNTANFSDLNKAMEWLSKIIIGQHGFVTFQVKAGRQIDANPLTYTSPVVIDHPNSDKISIIGEALEAGQSAPTSATFQISYGGFHILADGNKDLQNLQAIYTTELHFSGCSGVISTRGASNATTPTGLWNSTPILQNLLITGDGTGTSSVGLTIWGTGGALLDTISVHGFSGYGCEFQQAELYVKNALTASYNGGNGITMWQATIGHTCQICSVSNGATGVTMEGGAFDNSGSIGTSGGTQGIFSEGNASFGIYLTGGAFFSEGKNGAYSSACCNVQSNGSTTQYSGAQMLVANNSFAFVEGGAFIANGTFTATTSVGSNQLTSASAWSGSIEIGATVTGTGIPGGTVITAMSGNTVTMSNNATANGSITVTVSGIAIYVTNCAKCLAQNTDLGGEIYADEGSHVAVTGFIGSATFSPAANGASGYTSSNRNAWITN